MRIGLAGRLAQAFLRSKLTPLFVLVSLLLGVFAIVMTAKEEEPQIKVPMIDVTTMASGFSPEQVEKRITEPMERALSALNGVEHVYSTSLENASLVTVRFLVGQDIEDSLIKVHHKVAAMQPTLPSEARAPVVRSYTIDDVPFYTITFHSPTRSSAAIREAVYPFARRLQDIDGVADFDIIGGQRKVARVRPSLEKLAASGLTVVELKQAVEGANAQYYVTRIRERSPEPVLEVGSFVSRVQDLARVPIGRRFGRSLTLGDVATIEIAYDDEKSRVSFGKEHEPAVTAVYTKKKGVNAAEVTKRIKAQLDELGRVSLPPDIKWAVTRDYGATAEEKSDELIKHLWIATLSVMVLIALMMGLRVSLVVGIAVPVTLSITLFLYFILGYTLNRVTLFALIFSIGILVDDAIVVVENIYRHLSLGIHKAREMAIAVATDEVGNPTILATFAVIVAIMPMAFVGGLMGPYMRPIPIGASLAMLFSLLVAFIVTPWASRRLVPDPKQGKHGSEHGSGRLIAAVMRPMMAWLIARRRNSALALVVTFVLLAGAVALVLASVVKVKMLPFDNKAELQVLVDLPPGTTLAQTDSLLSDMTQRLYGHPEVRDVESYVGTAAPFSFSGLVKHTFLRADSYRGDLQVNLVGKHERDRQSHELARAFRDELMKTYGHIPGIKLKLLEIPPGPPVLATLLAEIYHPDPRVRQATLSQVERAFRATPGVVDIDTTDAPPQPKLFFAFDRNSGLVHGVTELAANGTLLLAMGDVDLFEFLGPPEDEPIFMRLSLAPEDRATNDRILSLLVPSMEGDKVHLRALLQIQHEMTALPLVHKDLRPVAYVMGEAAGESDSPIYAVRPIDAKLTGIDVRFTETPWLGTAETPTVKWDGEMTITLEVFRDLGIAFAVALILIMCLVVGWYDSFIVPFIIMVPVPLSLIGIIPFHWALGAFFTATSMIGFIAGAGITVRNSILLVDFIEQRRAEGDDCATAVIESTVIRFRPILLTALAVIVAGFVILFDPVFQGLAASLMAGAIVSALLSIPLVPVLYYWLRRGKQGGAAAHCTTDTTIETARGS